jgi:hypothetical protein
MQKIYSLLFQSFIVTAISLASVQFAYSQSKSSSQKDFYENALRSQVFISFNYIPKIGEQDVYLRKGYQMKVGFVKPFYNEHSDDFARVYSVVVEAGYGRTDAEGALNDIKNQKSVVSLAVINSLSPAYTTNIKRGLQYNIGAGLRQDLHFSKFNISVSATTGYQRVERPEFRLEDQALTFISTGGKVVYSKSAAINAAGLYFKPGID